MPENIPTSPASSVAAAPGASNAPEDPAKRALQALLPEFYAAVGEFEDLTRCAAVSMAGLSVKAAEFGPIVMPGSDALIIGEFYLYNPGDRLLMLPDDPAVYYLEQRNGAITKMADGVFNFFNKTLVKYLYSD